LRQGVTLEHYTKLLTESEFITWTKNSLLVTLLATLVSLVIGTMAAYALARLKFFAVGSFGTGIFVTYLVPTSLLFLPLAQVVNWLGLADSKWALVVIYYWGQLMAGAVLGSVPIVILYVFFLDYYVSGLTAGAVK